MTSYVAEGTPVYTVQVSSPIIDVTVDPANNVVGVVTIGGPPGIPGPPGQGAYVSGETPVGTMNSANTIFSLVNNFRLGSTALYRNGIRQVVSLHYNEVAPNLVVVDDAPGPGDEIIVDYEVA